ncbi:TPA: hypothetical protein N0F65_011952 [Lagenidium giganteum]|nr:TPA: hypothetical protein N0F65_011952 [Lagenidium giganteum]
MAPAAVDAVTATYHDYNGVKPEQTFCNIQFKSNKRITAYANLGSDLQCGDCVEVTNSRTKSKLVVKVVDKGGNIFDLAQDAFDTLDTDKNGYAQGHMNIEYKKVPCTCEIKARALSAYNETEY